MAWIPELHRWNSYFLPFQSYKIVLLVIDKLWARILQQWIGLVVCKDALKQIAETGFDPVYGGPLKRYV